VHEIAQRELYPASVPAGFQAGPGVRGVFAGGTARGPVGPAGRPLVGACQGALDLCGGSAPTRTKWRAGKSTVPLNREAISSDCVSSREVIEPRLPRKTSKRA